MKKFRVSILFCLLIFQGVKVVSGRIPNVQELEHTAITTTNTITTIDRDCIGKDCLGDFNHCNPDIQDCPCNPKYEDCSCNPEIEDCPCNPRSEDCSCDPDIDNCDCNPTIEECECCTTCVRASGATADPHYRTWDWSSYDFQGGCDQIAVDNDIFQLQIRTRPRGGYSIVTQAALWFKDAPTQYLRLRLLDTSGSGSGSVDYINDIPATKIDDSQITGNLRYYKFVDHPFSYVRMEVGTWGGGFINIEVRGRGSLLCGSKGMFGDWDEGGVTKQSGDPVSLPASYNSAEIASLAQSWALDPADSFLHQPSTDCNPNRECGPGEFFDDCTSTRKRGLGERALETTSCGATCDDITEPVLRSFCEIDIALTGDAEWACQKTYTDPVLGDPIDPCNYVNEVGSNEFVWRLIKNTARIRTCDWLNDKQEKIIEKICGDNVDYWEDPGTGIMYDPPQKACPQTCNACDQCYENPKTKYTKSTSKVGTKLGKSGKGEKSEKSGKSAKSGSAKSAKAETAQCRYLKKAKNKNAICNKNTSEFGYPSAAEACPQSCNLPGC